MVKNDIEILEGLGLSKNECKIYLSLLETGASAPGKIAEHSKVHRTNVYDALAKLTEKGMVKYFERENKKYFEGTEPENLLNLLLQKESEVKKILPRLNLLKDLTTKSSFRVSISEGMVAARNSLLRHLIWKKPIYTIGTPSTASNVTSAFVKQFHKKRISMKIPMHHLYNSDAAERAKVVNRWEYTTARVLPKGFISPISTNVCGDEAIMRIWGDDAIVIRLHNPKIAKAYKNYYKMLYQISTDP